MNRTVVLTVLGVLAVATGLTAAMRRFAVTHGVLDVPNARSSHVNPTPRGGGAAIVVASNLALIILVALQRVPLDLAIALWGGLPVALIGFIDDRRPVPARIRLLVHIAAAIWALAWLGGLPALSFGERTVAFGALGYALGALGIVWTLNLFNFMDGIDGIAGSEAVFIACAGGVLMLLQALPGPATVSLAFAAASAGFLVWNWPPAKIFMGDVGSGYLGYVIAILALTATRSNPAAVWAWLILGGAFFVDATVTLVRRAALGESLHVAHRSHAYQWLSRKWRSHLAVTSCFAAINLLWLFPCALVASLYPGLGAPMVVLALLPLVLLALRCGAGQPESS